MAFEACEVIGNEPVEAGLGGHVPEATLRLPRGLKLVVLRGSAGLRLRAPVETDLKSGSWEQGYLDFGDYAKARSSISKKRGESTWALIHRKPPHLRKGRGDRGPSKFGLLTDVSSPPCGVAQGDHALHACAGGDP